MSVRMRRGGATAGVMLAFLLAGAASANADLVVNTTTDSLTPGAGQCSLREAIAAVNNGAGNASCGTVNGSGSTQITLPAGTYTLSLGELHVTGNAYPVIVGADPSNPAATTIDAAGHSRVLEIDATAAAQLSAIEVTGGRTAPSADSNAAGGYAGEADGGAGILNNGLLSMHHVAVINNMTGHGGRGGDGANGDASHAATGGGGGGGGGEGAGIYNGINATLTVSDSTISGNLTGDGGNGGNGGMGYSTGSGAPGGPGGVPGRGGGIFNWGSAEIYGTTISGNATGRGGLGGGGGPGGGSAGIGADGGMGGNSGVLYSGGGTPVYAATLGGGGIANQGSLVLDKSTLSNNSTGAGGDGGDAGNGGPANFPPGSFGESGKGGSAGSGGLGAGLLLVGSDATLTNDTISGNVAGDGGTGGNSGDSAAYSLSSGNGGFGGYGAGVWAGQDSYTGHTDAVTLTNVTIAGNSVGAAGLPGTAANPNEIGIDGGRGLGAGLTIDTGSTLSENETLIAGNGAPSSGDLNCNAQGATITDAGYNLGYPDSSCPGVHVDPLLAALANNGSSTQTMLPGLGSPAIDAVPVASCHLTVDQRGEPRPSTAGTACDIGAVERQASDPTGSGSGSGSTGSGGGGSTSSGGGAGSTGSGGGGGSTGSGGASSGGSQSTVVGPSPTQIKSALAALLRSPAGQAAAIQAILKAKGITLVLKSPTAGRLVLRWLLPVSKRGAHGGQGAAAKPTLLASGAVTCTRAGSARVKLRLTAAGLRLLRRVRTVQLIESASFSTGSSQVTASAKLRLKRR